jgi:hypothetical protein
MAKRRFVLKYRLASEFIVAAYRIVGATATRPWISCRGEPAEADRVV